MSVMFIVVVKGFSAKLGSKIKFLRLFTKNVIVYYLVYSPTVVGSFLNLNIYINLIVLYNIYLYTTK